MVEFAPHSPNQLKTKNHIKNLSKKFANLQEPSIQISVDELITKQN
jgi:hypothetical protein